MGLVEKQLEALQEQLKVAQSIGANLEGRYSVCGIPSTWELVLQGEMVYRGIEKGIGFTKNQNFVNGCHEVFEKQMRLVNNLKARIDANSVDAEEIKRKREGKGMNSFRSILEAIKKAHEEISLETIDIYERYNQNEEQWARRPHMSDDAYAIKHGEYLSTKKALKEEMEEQHKKMNDVMDNCRSKMNELIQKHYTINPAKINQETMNLVQMGVIDLRDYPALIEQNKNNVTMLRVLDRALVDKIEKYEAAGDTLGIASCKRTRNSMTKYIDPAYYTDGLKTIEERGASTFSFDRAARAVYSKSFGNIIEGAVQNSNDFVIE